MRLKCQSNGKTIDLDQNLQIAVGGEACIYKVQGGLLAKIYHKPTDERARKLALMVQNPPKDPMASYGHISIAWPLDLLQTMDGTNRVIGFLMQRAQGDRIINFYIPKERRSKNPLFSYLYLIRTARNLATAVYALHERGYVIGDVNESNILVLPTALVTLIDTDSFQVRDLSRGIVYRCPVGKPEFTPPELQGKIFAHVDRSPEHDLFGLAVLVFQLLMEGTHPFAGIYKGTGDPPLCEDSIAKGHFPYSRKRSVPYDPPRYAPPFDILHPSLRNLFVRCFEDGHVYPKRRPTADEWRDALSQAENALVTCNSNDQHFYGNHLSVCPWCERTRRTGVDPFPPKQSPTQTRKPAPPPQKAQPVSPIRPIRPSPQRAWIWAMVVSLLLAISIDVILLSIQIATSASVVSIIVASLASLVCVVIGLRSARGFARRSLKLLGLTPGIFALLFTLITIPIEIIEQTKQAELPRIKIGKDGAEMVLIPAGEFQMGSNDGDYDEKPVHTVYLDAFYIDKYEVTNAQYKKFMDATGHKAPNYWNDSRFNDPKQPVVGVSWYDAKAYADWAGKRLPTEAEWEKSARGGLIGKKYPSGDNLTRDDANYDGTGGKDIWEYTSPVGSFAPNGYGLYDMAGNVWEWCADWYDGEYYKVSPKENPKGPASGNWRVIRGGSWYYVINGLRVANRNSLAPTDVHYDVGFRCAQ